MNKTRKRVPKIIYFFGPEGVGKTTQISLLNLWLRRKGHKVKISRVMANHGPVYVLNRILIRLGRRRYFERPDGTRSVMIDAVLWPKIMGFFLFLDFVTVLLLSLIRVLIPLKLGYTVLCERYLLDTFAYMQYATWDLSTYYGVDIRDSFAYAAVSLLPRFVPRKTVMVFLDADYHTLLERYRKRGTYAEGEAYVSFHKTVVKSVLKRYNSIYINTEKNDIPETFLKVSRFLEKVLL